MWRRTSPSSVRRAPRGLIEVIRCVVARDAAICANYLTHGIYDNQYTRRAEGAPLSADNQQRLGQLFVQDMQSVEAVEWWLNAPHPGLPISKAAGTRDHQRQPLMSTLLMEKQLQNSIKSLH